MINDSTYDIYIRILINREKQEAKIIFKPKTFEEALGEVFQNVINRALWASTLPIRKQKLLQPPTHY